MSMAKIGHRPTHSEQTASVKDKHGQCLDQTLFVEGESRDTHKQQMDVGLFKEKKKKLLMKHFFKCISSAMLSYFFQLWFIIQYIFALRIYCAQHEEKRKRSHFSERKRNNYWWNSHTHQHMHPTILNCNSPWEYKFKLIAVILVFFSAGADYWNTKLKKKMQRSNKKLNW